MKIKGTQEVEIEIDKNQLAYAIMFVVEEKLRGIDDAGCDWMTEGNRTYISDSHWLVSENSEIAILVNAANILKYGAKLNLP